MLFILAAFFLVNQVLCALSVSRRRFGWATAYGLSALWCAICFGVEYGAIQ
jgi:uncharacterized membrane protein YecN with MAPEG domain